MEDFKIIIFIAIGWMLVAFIWTLIEDKNLKGAVLDWMNFMREWKENAVRVLLFFVPLMLISWLVFGP